MSDGTDDINELGRLGQEQYKPGPNPLIKDPVDDWFYSDENFVRVINQCGIPDRELADRLRVSYPTVVRWKEGLNLPRHVMRKLVMEVLT